MKAIRIASIISLALLAQARADYSLPSDYFDFSGTYVNPVCEMDGLLAGSQLLGELGKYIHGKNFKLHVNQKHGGAIQDGKEFNIVTIDTFTEADIHSEIPGQTTHYKSDEISKTVFDSRTGKSMDPGYTWKENGLAFHEKKIVKDEDLLGYRSRNKFVTDEILKLADGKLVVEGTIQSSGRGVMFFVIPFWKEPRTYRYRCAYDRQTE